MKKMIVSAFLLFSITVLFTACTGGATKEENAVNSVFAQDSDVLTSQPESDAYHKIDAEEAKKMMDEQKVTVLDVRTAEEYAEGHIPTALLIPLGTIGDVPPAALSDKEAVLLVYCRTGVRSKRAADQLVKLGYQNVYDFGGITDWPYETETGEHKE